MYKYLFIAIFLLLCSPAKSQRKIFTGGFCTVLNGRWVTLNIGLDSVFFEYRIADRHDIQAFVILQQKQQENYLFLSIGLPNNGKIKKTSYLEGLYIIKLPRQNKQDSILIYHDKSKLDLKEEISLLNIAKFNQQFYETWYSEGRFQTFVTFKDCTSASKEELQAIGHAWLNRFNVEKLKISANREWQSARSEIAENIWTSTLVNFHFNPVISFTALHGYFMEKKVPIPLIIDRSANAEPFLDSAFANSQRIIINMPKSNNR